MSPSVDCSSGEAAVAFAGDGELVIEERSNRPLGLS